MNCNSVNNKRQEKLNQLKNSLKKTDENILSLLKELDWDYEKLVNPRASKMVTCSINPQHTVPESRIKSHEEKCSWHQKGYRDDDKPFSDHSSCGSFITLSSEMFHSITNNITKSENRTPRAVPQTSANLDQNFNREEKLAIYDYVIANTQQQKSFSDLCLQPFEKKEEKREMTAWEIAAAERDAKRRRASYRNKVHTNRKTITEIMREVIEVQMEALKEEITVENQNKTDGQERHKKKHKKHKSKSRDDKKYSDHESSQREREDRHKSKDHDKHSKHKDRHHKRSAVGTGSEYHSRSRSHDKYRKWKSYKERSPSHKLSNI